MEFGKSISMVFLISLMTVSSSTIAPASISPSQSPSSPGLISVNDICKNTKNPGGCVAFVSPFLTGPTTDPVSALDIILDGIFKRVERAISISKQASSAETLSDDMLKSLKKCLESYDQVRDDLGKAVASSATKDLNSVNALLASSIANVGECDKAFADQGAQNPMKEIDATLIELTGYALDISESLK